MERANEAKKWATSRDKRMAKGGGHREGRSRFSGEGKWVQKWQKEFQSRYRVLGTAGEKERRKMLESCLLPGKTTHL
jgi:hypothetical protein